MKQSLTTKQESLIGQVAHYIKWDGFDVRTTAKLIGATMEDVTKIINSEKYKRESGEPMLLGEDINEMEIRELVDESKIQRQLSLIEGMDRPMLGFFGTACIPCPNCGSRDVDEMLYTSGKIIFKCEACKFKMEKGVKNDTIKGRNQED